MDKPLEPQTISEADLETAISVVLLDLSLSITVEEELDAFRRYQQLSSQRSPQQKARMASQRGQILFRFV